MDMKLVVFNEDGSRRDIQIKPGTYVVGRNEQAGIRIPLPSVSRAHCELVVDDDGARLRDLGSSNGTFKNRKRIDHAELSPGDVISVGDFQMTVQIDGEPAEIAPPEFEPPRRNAESDTPTAAGNSDSSMMDESAGDGLGSDPLADDDSSFDLSFLDDDDENPEL